MKIALQQAIDTKANGNINVKYLYFTPRQINTHTEFTNIVSQLGLGFYIFTVGWEEYTSFPHAGSNGYIIVTGGSGCANGKLREYGNANYTHGFYWVDTISVDRYSGLVAI